MLSTLFGILVFLDHQGPKSGNPSLPGHMQPRPHPPLFWEPGHALLPSSATGAGPHPSPSSFTASEVRPTFSRPANVTFRHSSHPTDAPFRWIFYDFSRRAIPACRRLIPAKFLHPPTSHSGAEFLHLRPTTNSGTLQCITWTIAPPTARLIHRRPHKPVQCQQHRRRSPTHPGRHRTCKTLHRWSPHQRQSPPFPTPGATGASLRNYQHSAPDHPCPCQSPVADRRRPLCRARYGRDWKAAYEFPDIREHVLEDLRRTLCREIRAAYLDPDKACSSQRPENQARCPCYLHRYFGADEDIRFPNCPGNNEPRHKGQS